MEKENKERNRTEQELRRSEQQLQSILDKTSAVVYLKDTRGRYILINDRYEGLFRIRKDQVAGKTDYDLFPKEMADAFRANDQAVLQAGKPLEFEEVAPHDDGPHTYVSVKFPLQDATGAPYGVCGISTDITERVRTEQELKGARARLETLIASSPAVIYSTKIGGNWDATFISDNVTAQVGYQPKEFTDNPGFWAEHIHPEDAPRVISELRQLLEKGHHSHEYRFLHKEGTYRWMEDKVRLVRDANGRPFEAVGYWIDITDRKTAESELRKSEANLSALIENASESICSFDRKFKLIAFNSFFRDQFLHFFNRKPEVGESLDSLFKEGQFSEIGANWKRHIARALDGEKFTIEREVNLAGDERYYMLSLNPIVGDRDITGATVFAKDITELKRAEKVLEHQVELEKLVADVSRNFINIEPDEIDGAVSSVLGMIGEFKKVDRCRLFLLSYDSDRMDSAYEWCADGIESQIERSRNATGRSFPWARERISNLQTTNISCVEDLPPEAEAEKRELQAMGVKSILAVPIAFRGAAIGVLSLQTCRSERSWPAETVRILQVVEEIIGTALQRARAERELKRLSHQYQMILDAAGEGIYGLDLEGRATFVNPAAARMLGWKPEDLIGKSMHEVLHHTFPDGTPYPTQQCPVHSGFIDGAVRRVDDELFWRKDGGSFPVEYIGTPIRENGRLVGTVVTFNDITLRKRAEEVHHLADLLGQVPDAVLVMDQRGKLLFWNNGAEKLTGYRAQEVIGDHLSVIFAKEDPGGGAHAILERLADPEMGGEYRGEHLILRGDGETRLIGIHFSSSYDPHGPGTAWIGIAQEITEARRREQEMIHAQRLAEVGTLAAGVAHEINNPLSVLLGNIQILLERSRRSGQQRRRVEQMKKVCDRISHVVDGLLEISAPPGRQWVLTNVNETIEGTLLLAEQLTEKKGIRFVRRYAPDLPKLRLLQNGLQQIVMNLVTNAQDAIEDDGEITVTTAKTTDAFLPRQGILPSTPGPSPGGGIPRPCVCICVSDTGPGITGANLSKIFLPFFSTKEPGKGTGLGLTLTRSIVSMHRGRVDVESEPERGTTFKVTIPVS